jgi:hypothetical protein
MSDTTWRVVVGVLAVALVAVGGILIAVLIGQGGPTPTASPSVAVSISPSPSVSLSPSPTLSPPPTASPTVIPTTGEPTTPPPATPTQTPPPTAAPTAAPTLAPGGPVRQIQIIGLGLDAEDVPEGAVERLISFQVDGPAQIVVRVSDVTAGRARTCLWLGTALNKQDEECRGLRNGQLERTITEPGQTTWSVSLIGRGAQISPSANVALSFNAQAAAIIFDGFRFQGTGAENYNGITAEFPVLAAGEAHIIFEIDDGEDGQYAYSLVIERLGPDGGVVHESGGLPVDNDEAAQSVSAGRSYRLTLSNSEEFVDQQVFVRGTLSWP